MAAGPRYTPGLVGLHAGLELGLGGAERQDLLLGRVDVDDGDVEVELLGPGRVRPGGRLVVVGLLEAQAHLGAVAQRHPVVAGRPGDLAAHQRGVELGQPHRVRTIEHHGSERCDTSHGDVLPVTPLCEPSELGTVVHKRELMEDDMIDDPASAAGLTVREVRSGTRDGAHQDRRRPPHLRLRPGRPVGCGHQPRAPAPLVPPDHR